MRTRSNSLRVVGFGLLVVLAGAVAIGRKQDLRVGLYPGPLPIPQVQEPSGSVPTGTADSAVVIVYGDNRPGHRLLTHHHGARVVYEALESRSPRSLVWGFLNLPLALLQAVFPTLDGFRDAWSMFVTHRFSGGNEMGVLHAIEANRGVDLVINTGDIVLDGRRGGMWAAFVERHQALRARARYLAVPGNHEKLWDPIGRANWDAVIGPPARSMCYWTTVDLGHGIARVVMLDSNVLRDTHDRYDDALDQALTDAQLAWADSVLALPARWKFVILHHPIVTSGHHWDSWTEVNERPVADRRIPLLAMLRRHRVAAVFAGHEHLYNRSYIGYPSGHGFWHIITGGGGSPLHYVSNRDRGLARVQAMPDSSSLALMEPERSAYHYCRLVLHPEPDSSATGAELRVYQVDLRGNEKLIDAVNLVTAP